MTVYAIVSYEGRGAYTKNQNIMLPLVATKEAAEKRLLKMKDEMLTGSNWNVVPDSVVFFHSEVKRQLTLEFKRISGKAETFVVEELPVYPS